MKVALVQDYLKEYGGAERVLEVFHEMFPNAPLYTVLYAPKFLGPHRSKFDTWKIHTTWFDKVPFRHKLLSYFRLIAPFVFSAIDLSDYDLVITNCNGSYTSPNFVKIGPKTKLISYIHTPPRYLYGYETASPWRSVWWRKVLYVFGRLPMHILRILDFQAAQRPAEIIVNSQETYDRVWKFYRRKANIVHAPVDSMTNQKVSKEFVAKLPKEFFLDGGRLARPKHVEMAIEACNDLKLPLVVFGRAFMGYGEELRKLAGPTITFFDEVSDPERAYLMSHAKAFIFCAKDEDFGIMPVESMSVGVPVVAYPGGGVVETVIQDKTGMFFNEFTVESLKKALKDFENKKWNKKIIENHAKQFGRPHFEKEIRKVIAKK